MIIAGAGGAAHLFGVVAAFSTVPVIGVPCRSSISIDGWDSILSNTDAPLVFLWLQLASMPHKMLVF